MNQKAFFLLLKRQFSQKWGRFLLASGGITIGIWAITLTASLSLGLADTIITAINSQPAAKEIYLYKLEDGKTSFLDLEGPPVFLPISEKELQGLQEEIEPVVGTSPSELMNIFLHTDLAADDQKCVNSLEFAENGQLVDPTENDLLFFQKCRNITIFSTVFQNFYETHRSKWIGQTEEPGEGEIVVCYKCGGIDFNLLFEDIDSPEDFLGRKIKLEIEKAPEVYQLDQIIDVTNFERNPKRIKEFEPIELEIVAVIDDRESNSFSFTGGASNNFYLNNYYYNLAVLEANPEFNLEEVGYVENRIIIDSYDDLESTVDELQDRGYLAFSLAEALISGVEIVFLVLTIVLAGFGVIALIASVFGIINVMIISVLERKKEIGILKSLGAKDSDIFKIFLLETSSLGVIGWALGTGVSLFMGFLVSLGFRIALDRIPSFADNLDSLNISDFSPIFPWWLLLGTFALALTFTISSGVYPAIKASKQNPVDVLRGE